MNSNIKSLTETSSEVRDFEISDVTELEIWLPAVRIDGILTGYFSNYVGDADGLFIVLDSEPGKIYRITDLDALKDCLVDAEVWIDCFVYGVESTDGWRLVEGTEAWIIVDEPWKFVYEYADKMTALEHTRTQNWAAQRDYENWKAEVEYDLCLDDFFYWDGYRNDVFKVNEPVTVVALDEGLGKYRADEYLVLKGDHTERIAAEEEKYGTDSGNRSVMKFIDKPGYVWFEPEFERIEYIGADKKEALKHLIIVGNNPREESITELLNLGVLVKVQNSDALFENLNIIVCSESSVVYFVDGSEPLNGIEAVLDKLTEFADTTKGYYHSLCDTKLYEYKESIDDDILSTEYGKEYHRNGALEKNIMDGYDAGWLSPDGKFYGENGTASNLIHLRIAEKLSGGNMDGDRKLEKRLNKNTWE